ncbi:malate dehydrogenase, mitochondrial isoform X1 [Plutella xylostella]|uniref:malate dehydrogenase, mitochondrial isoform X1 n=1 Tax=Plutella xylostella TaxID=51655 RepID=UPI002032DD79|nr:malate dehydrogenase, mitochondrial isoform X1 [Plutella xylostella]
MLCYTNYLGKSSLWVPNCMRSMLLPHIIQGTKSRDVFIRYYAKKYSADDGCAKAIKDLPPKEDPEDPCPPCDKKKKEKGILHKIKLKVLEGGSNFGTPFRLLRCPPEKSAEEEKKIPLLPAPKKKLKPPCPEKECKPGVQVSILGADTAIGQYIAFLLKQCPAIKSLRLYEATDNSSSGSRELRRVVQDLQTIDTNCSVQGYSYACFQHLESCLQNTDIVLMLESGDMTPELAIEQRFLCQAPTVKRYADVIAAQCPSAFVIVCASPIDCMVPLVAETLKETNWYDPRKLLGSLAVPEMRASSIAARALSLEPKYIRVPCVGGTEGESLVPLFSKAVEYFDFSERNAQMLTDAVRASSRPTNPDCCARAADLSEAHAVAGLVLKVAHALLCNDVSKVTGFVEADPSQVISPCRFRAVSVLLNSSGVFLKSEFPRMSSMEMDQLALALDKLTQNVEMTLSWYNGHLAHTHSKGQQGTRLSWFQVKHYDRLYNCMNTLT